jgi:predicted HicB family RNase H-like nuclease
MELLNHKGFSGSVETSIADNVLHGKVLFINDLVTYEAENVQQLKAEFVSAVEDYLETCKAIGKKPEKSLSGQFNVRITPEQHRSLCQKAAEEKKPLNAIMTDAVCAYLADSSAVHNHHHTHAHEVTLKVEPAEWSSGVTSENNQFFPKNVRFTTQH